MGIMSELDLRKIDLDGKAQNINVMLIEEEEKSNFSQPSEGSKKGTFEKGELKGFFNLNADLERGNPIELGEVKEVSTSEKVYGAEGLLGELKKHASVVSLPFLYNTPLALSLSKGELYRGVPFMVRHAHHERIVK